jgi:hypothetical protein
MDVAENFDFCLIIPTEVLRLILLSYLDLKSLKVFPIVSKSWYSIEENYQRLWSSKTENEFGKSSTYGPLNENVKKKNPSKAVSLPFWLHFYRIDLISFIFRLNNIRFIFNLIKKKE